MECNFKKWKEMKVDCLINIFQRLTLEDLALVVAFVCRSWHKASLDPLCWITLDFQTLNYSPVTRNSSFPRFLTLAVTRGCGQAVELRFPYRASLDDLVYAANECPKLKVVALPDFKCKDDEIIPQLIGKWKDLEQLEMDVKPACFPELMEQISINCDKFTGLRVTGSISKEDALAIVKFTPKLKYLNLNGSYLPREELMVIMKGCKEIERLSVNCCIGFQADKEVVELGSRIRVFEHHGSMVLDFYACDALNYLTRFGLHGLNS